MVLSNPFQYMTAKELEELETFFRRAIENDFYLDSPVKMFLREILEQIREEIRKI
jgi:hypothetical protein